MKNTLNLKCQKYFIALVSFLLIYSCDDMEIEDTVNSSLSDVVMDEKLVNNLLETATIDAYWGITNSWGTHFHLMADQITSVNKARQFWDFAEEPRIEIPNVEDYGAYGFFETHWNNLNSAVTVANRVITALESHNRIDGIDITESLAEAYFAKGFAQGFLGVIFDQAYLIDSDTDVFDLQLRPYPELVSASLNNILHSLKLARSVEGFRYNAMPKVDFGIEDFEQYANSMMARIYSSQARTSEEAATLDWAQILLWAEDGFEDDFFIETTPNVWFNETIDWASYRLNSGPGYLPTDLKVVYFADPNYPFLYPERGILREANSTDLRFQQYFNYAHPFGFTWDYTWRKNRSIASNYLNVRWMTNNNMSEAGDMNPQFLRAEVQMLKAEAYYRLGNLEAAAAAINNSPRTNVGGLEPLTAQDDLLHALHYEYSIELDQAAGSTTQWAFMRRNDLLQEGTPLHLSVPAAELKLAGLSPYSIGGIGQPNSARSKGWKKY